MTLLVCASDFHGDWETLGLARYEEVEAAAERSVMYAIDHKADYYIFLGDLADPETGGGTFKSIFLALNMALMLADHEIPSIWLAGNHDVCDDGTGATVLTPLRALRKERDNLVFVFERPNHLLDRRNGLKFLAFPFTSPSHAYDPSDFCKKLAWEIDAKTVVLSHLTIPGIHAGSETNDMPRGREISFPSKETAKAGLRLQGHYHRRQKFDLKDGGSPIQVVGSLCRLGFGEEGNDPGFLAIDI